MPNSNNAYSYESLLNTIPVGEDGSMIELRPVIKGDDVRWCWSARLGVSVRRCLSGKSFDTREDAFEDASEWWGNYSQYCGRLRDRTPPLRPYQTTLLSEWANSLATIDNRT